MPRLVLLHTCLATLELNRNSLCNQWGKSGIESTALRISGGLDYSRSSAAESSHQDAKSKVPELYYPEETDSVEEKTKIRNLPGPDRLRQELRLQDEGIS